MSQSNTLCAEALVEHRKAITEAARQHLCEHTPQMVTRFGENSQDHWTDHFLDRITELSESVSAGEPQIFCNHVSWAKQAMAARNIDAAYLSGTLESLRFGIETVISGDMAATVIACFDKAITLHDAEDQAAWESALDPRHTCDSVALHYIQAVIS